MSSFLCPSLWHYLSWCLNKYWTNIQGNILEILNNVLTWELGLCRNISLCQPLAEVRSIEDLWSKKDERTSTVWWKRISPIVSVDRREYLFTYQAWEHQNTVFCSNSFRKCIASSHATFTVTTWCFRRKIIIHWIICFKDRKLSAVF